MNLLKCFFDKPAPDMERLSETEQLTYGVFQDILEHGKAPGGKILTDLILAQHIGEDPETGMMYVTETGFGWIEYLERKAGAKE